MDTAAILEQYTQDLSNLPSELAHLLGELKEKDARFYETRKRIVSRDNSIHKFIRQNGTLTKFPKEQATYQRMEEDFALAEKYQKEKCILANTALLLIAKHLVRLENDIGKLESEGLLAPLEEINMYPALTSAPTPTAPEIAAPLKVKKRKQSTNTRNSTPMPTKPVKRLKTEELEDKKIITVSPVTTPIIVSTVNTMPTSNGAKDGNEEDQLYCFCQQVSFGNMVGCDNDDCKYEWFHYDCVGLKEPPVGKWFCSDCKAKLALSREKKKK